MFVETTRGQFDDGELVKTQGVIDTPNAVRFFVEYRFRDGELASRSEGGGFAKVNAFQNHPSGSTVPVEVIEGEISQLPVSALDRKLITVDGEGDFTSAVEYRLPGTDRIVHRSVDVKLKRLPGIDGAAGGI